MTGPPQKPCWQTLLVHMSFAVHGLPSGCIGMQLPFFAQ
jgi:hypothetical protein